MTSYSHIRLAARPASSSRRLLERLGPLALAALCFAVLAVAWLAFFALAPFDFTPLR